MAGAFFRLNRICVRYIALQCRATGFSHCVQERLLIAAARLDEILRRGRRAVGFEGGGVACEGGDPGSSSACIASKVIAGMHQERVALSRSSSTHELAGARDPILYALTHLRDGTGSIDAVQHDLPLLCLIVHELLLQDLARLRDAGRTVRLF